MRRILQLIKGLGGGGAERLLSSAAPYVDRAAFEWEVAYLLPWKDALVEEIHRSGLTVHCLDGARGFGWVRRLRELAERQQIDLVHCHSPVAAVGARLALERRIPRVYTEHGDWKHYHPATHWANLLTFSRNDHVFAVSREVRDSIRYPKPLRFLRMPPVETLYHGLDPSAVTRWPQSDGVREELGIPDGAPVVGTVANFRALKGHRHLLEAAVHVRREIPEARFVLVGQGPLEAAVRQRARTLGLDGTVVFAGYRDDVPRVAGIFDVFALSSLFEGLSIALIEAMALGKPAVVTEVGGIPEVVQHMKQGLIVPPGNARALAEAIVTLLRDPSLRERLGEAARHRAADFDIRKAVRRMEEVYRELLA
jgi:glycosyltransferase involved in cell wall biosynthesis